MCSDPWAKYFTITKIRHGLSMEDMRGAGILWPVRAMAAFMQANGIPYQWRDNTMVEMAATILVVGFVLYCGLVVLSGLVTLICRK